jgi:DNA adenine methylase
MALLPPIDQDRLVQIPGVPVSSATPRHAPDIPNELLDDLGGPRTVLSPLRYPGGKRRLVPYIAALLRVNDLRPDLFVEPFAGGASVALELAAFGLVKRIGLGDLDPYIAGFWETAFFDCDWLCRQVEEIEVTLETWERMKHRQYGPRRSRALACLFLNRTSFNGSLHGRAGPIGGKDGSSSYELGCRFPRQRLVRRLRVCAQLAADGRVAFVECASALEVIGRSRSLIEEDESAFFYLDPPFWAKSDRLYRFGFAELDHRGLATALRYVHEPFLLSYDPAPEIERLYGDRGLRVKTVELLYTGSQGSAGSELVITNLARMPGDTRLWRTMQEWRDRRSRAVEGEC